MIPTYSLTFKEIYTIKPRLSQKALNYSNKSVNNEASIGRHIYDTFITSVDTQNFLIEVNQSKWVNKFNHYVILFRVSLSTTVAQFCWYLLNLSCV